MGRLGGIFKRMPLFLIVLSVVITGGFLPKPATAAEEPLPDTIHTAIDYLLGVNGNPQTKTVVSARLAPLVDFILQDKPAELQYVATSDGLLDPLVYHEFEVRQSLATILRYAFHPVIPSHVLALSSLRLAYWKEVDGRPGPVPKELSDRLTNLQDPLVIHGVEHEEITPDLTTGAYYSYDVNRTLIYLRVAGRPVWISLARQVDLSDVGRKGYVLGADEAWDYFYSGEKGVNMLGLGWVETYMYDAFSALVFVQEDDATARVRCGAFKWLRAGWNDMNFVKPEHIRGGLERYAETFEEIMGAPELPTPSQIASAVETIKALSRERIQNRARRELNELEVRYGNNDKFPDQWFEEAIVKGSYLNTLSRPQLEALLFLEYMKAALGRQPDPDRKLAQAGRRGERAVPRED
jgi:hypothetical protein